MRLFKHPLSDRMGVNALARFDRDVLSHPHADTVILMMGINDIGWPDSILAPHEAAPSVDAIIDGYKQLIARAHFHGMRIIGAFDIQSDRIQNGQPERDLPLDRPSGLPPSLTRDACRGYQPTKSSLFDTVPAGEDAMSLLKQRPYTGRSAGHGISTSKSPSPSRQRQLRAFSLIRTRGVNRRLHRLKQPTQRSLRVPPLLVNLCSVNCTPEIGRHAEAYSPKPLYRSVVCGIF